MHCPTRPTAYRYARCCLRAQWLEQGDLDLKARRTAGSRHHVDQHCADNGAPETVQNEAQLQCAIEAINIVRPRRGRMAHAPTHSRFGRCDFQIARSGTSRVVRDK